MQLPKPDGEIVARRSDIIAAMRAIVPGEGVIVDESELSAYECDGLTAVKQLPLIVVLPQTTEQVSQILKYCEQAGVKIVPRGAGTSLSGGATPLGDAITLGMTKFNQILEVDYDNRCIVTQPGVTNLALTQAVQADGFYFAPDPSSQIACSIGGNVAENAGGVHCLKYGVTTNNLLGVKMVLMDGEVITIGGKQLDDAGYDLLGLVTGSEGLLGVITEITVKIIPTPETAKAVLVGFPSNEQAGQCVASIIGAGIIPGGMEIMDRPAIKAVEEFIHAGYPLDVESLLIVELDGPKAEVNYLIERVEEIASKEGASSIRASQNEEERLLFWAGRKAAFPAVGRLYPDYLCMDGTIPRNKLPEILSRMKAMSVHYGLEIANVFHAGDGNLHPLIMFDANKPGELEKGTNFGMDILRACVEVGGVLTGEHGVGVEKRDLMGEVFSETELDQQERVKCAFDEKALLNPGKVFPKLKGCAELSSFDPRQVDLKFPNLPRF